MINRAILLAVIAAALNGQAVVSTRSGVVHYFEGAVLLNGQALTAHLGTFSNMSPGDVLQTQQGRAEVLLTPGTFLRLDQNSSIRMVATPFNDTRVELLSGSAMITATQPPEGTSLTLGYDKWQIHLLDQGVYRIDSAAADSSPARLWVEVGKAEVADPSKRTPVSVAAGMDLPLAAALDPETSTAEPEDALSTWARGRQDSISADNQIAENIQDPATLAEQDPVAPLGADGYSTTGFTQFPLIGLAPPVTPITPLGPVSPYPYGTVYGGYNSLYPYQPGFYSMYLPGYTYMPLFLALPTRVSPYLMGGSRGSGLTRTGRTPTVMPLTGYATPRGINNGPGSPLIRTYTPQPIRSRPIGISSAPINRPAPPPVIVRPAAPVIVPPVGIPGGVRGGGGRR